MAPPTNCISPIGEKAILSGLYKQIKGEFYTAVSRPPAVYRGNPFIIEAGLAYGNRPEESAISRNSRPCRWPKASRRGRLGTRARDPLREPGAVAVPAIGLRDVQSGARHDLAKLWHHPITRARCRRGPMVIFVHMASVWVPFTSESKEAIAEYDEIQKEITLALARVRQAAGVFSSAARTGGERISAPQYFRTLYRRSRRSLQPAEGRQAAERKIERAAAEDCELRGRAA